MPQYPMPFALLPIHVMRYYNIQRVQPETLLDMVARHTAVIEVLRTTGNGYVTDTFTWEVRKDDPSRASWRLKSSELTKD